MKTICMCSSHRRTLRNIFLGRFEESHDPKAPLFTFDGTMVAQKRKREEYESDVVSFLRRGSVSILEAVAMKLPDVFAAEILSKLGVLDTLNLAQVSKSYNDAVWSVEGVRSYGGEDQGVRGEDWTGICTIDALSGRVRQLARGQGPLGVWGGRQ